MKRWPALALGLAVILLTVGGCATLAGQYFADQALTTGPNGPETPADLGAPYQKVSIPSGSRRLDAYLVRAPGDCADPPAILIYHGFDETISYWAATQQFLYLHCVTSLVFDPTGSGDSPRPTSVAKVGQDASSAYGFARSALGPKTRIYVLGHSMGNAILLQAEPGFSPQPSGVIVADAFSSLRDFYAIHGAPGILAHAMPDWWDNVVAVRQVHVPVLVIHSDADKLVPLEEARRIYAAAGQPKSMTVVHGFPHNGLRRKPSEAWWASVLTFVHSPGVSTTPLGPLAAPPPAKSASANESETAREERIRAEALSLARPDAPDPPSQQVGQAP